MTLASGADPTNGSAPTFTVLHADGSNASHHDFQPLFSDMGPVAGCVRCATGRPDATAGPLNFSNCSRPGYSSLFFAPITTPGPAGGMCCAFNQSAGRVTDACAFGGTNANKDNVCPSGRSSSGAMPFFNVVHPQQKSGVVVGIGWTGQWAANLTKLPNSTELHVTAGMNHTNFLLHPGERVRSPSILMMHYTGDWVAGQNRFRQLITVRYTPRNAANRSFSLASGGSLTSPPFCYNESLAKAMAANIGVTARSFLRIWVAFFQECR